MIYFEKNNTSDKIWQLFTINTGSNFVHSLEFYSNNFVVLIVRFLEVFPGIWFHYLKFILFWELLPLTQHVLEFDWQSSNNKSNETILND